MSTKPVETIPAIDARDDKAHSAQPADLSPEDAEKLEWEALMRDIEAMLEDELCH